MLFYAINTKPEIGLPANVVYIEIECMLLQRGELVVDVDGLNALAQPFLGQEVLVLVDKIDLLLGLMLRSVSLDLPRDDV